MYRNLHNDIILSPPQETAARPTRAHDAEDALTTAARPRPRIRWLAGIGAIGLCIATTSVMTIAGAGATPRPTKHTSHVSARQLQREMRSLRAEGFVATSCTVDGTLMTNYNTNKSLLVKW